MECLDYAETDTEEQLRAQLKSCLLYTSRYIAATRALHELHMYEVEK